MSQDSMTSGWYYSKAGAPAGHEVGPLSWDDLYLFAQRGTIEPQDIVWNPKLPRGMAAGTLPQLFPGLQTAPTPAAQAATVPERPGSPTALPAAADDAWTSLAVDEVSDEPDGEKARKLLPLLVVLLVLALAVAGVAVYFLYFR